MILHGLAILLLPLDCFHHHLRPTISASLLLKLWDTGLHSYRRQYKGLVVRSWSSVWKCLRRVIIIDGITSQKSIPCHLTGTSETEETNGFEIMLSVLFPVYGCLYYRGGAWSVDRHMRLYYWEGISLFTLSPASEYVLPELDVVAGSTWQIPFFSSLASWWSSSSSAFCYMFSAVLRMPVREWIDEEFLKWLPLVKYEGITCCLFCWIIQSPKLYIWKIIQ